MKNIVRLTLVCFIAFMGFVALLAPAQAATGGEKALVIVRFNQARVYFDQQLYGAVAKAVAVKPDVTFAVVSYAPVTGDADVDTKWQAVASRNTQAVLNSMQKMGVPASRMEVTGQQKLGLKYDETHVFVR